jgi:tRNA(Ile)-lysidine synthase TilS/MesJ
MMICTNCVLSEMFPRIMFDAGGVCNHCQDYLRSKGRIADQRERYKKKFLDLLNELNDPAKRNQRPYDIIMAYSGGKDSTYTLRLLKEEFNLRILAVTFDHGFVSSSALENIRNITERLEVTHLNIRPPAKTVCELFVKSMGPERFPLKALERASAICNACMNVIKSFVLKTALESRAAMVAYGWSPGQAPIQSSVLKTNASMIGQMQKASARPIKEMIGDNLSGCFVGDHYFETYSGSEDAGFPYLVYPLSFMDYNEKEIIKNICEIGWKEPNDTDTNSTNCLLNSYANEIHIKRYGFHPYAFEIGGLVRQGYMGRDEGLLKLSTPGDPKVIGFVKEKLGIH